MLTAHDRRLISATILAASVLAACSSSPTMPNDAPAKTGPPAVTAAAAKNTGVELQFFLPQDADLATANPIQNIERLVAAFNQANPDITVIPEKYTYAQYGGNPTQRIQQALQNGKAPVALLPNEELYNLRDQDLILPVEDCIAKIGGKAYQDDFFAAFLRDSQDGGRLYGVPFYRTLPVLYYNKQLFQAVGLNPEKPPQTWDELAAYAQKLTQPSNSDYPAVWGLENALGWGFWQTLVLTNGQNLVNDQGTAVMFNTPPAVAALQFWVDLVRKQRVMPEGSTNYAKVLNDFRQGKVAMIVQSSALLPDVLKVAKFPLGVAAIPSQALAGVPESGWNFFLFKQTNPAEQDAACKLIQSLTTPERIADWSVDSGSVAVRKSAYDTQSLRDYLAQNPQAAVSRDQVKTAARDLMFHSNQKIYTALFAGLQPALAGSKPAAQALDQVQKQADQILAQGQ